MAGTKTLTKSYVHVPRKLPFLGLTVGQQLYAAADKYADKEMFVFYEDQERITFKELKEQSQLFAASLLAKGFKKGDTLAILGANHVEWLVVLYACAQLGIPVIGLRLEFPRTTIATFLVKLHCKALILTRSPLDLFDKVCDMIPELRHCQDGDLESKSFPDLKLVLQGEGDVSKGANSRCRYSIQDFMRLSSDEGTITVSNICGTIDIDDWFMTYFTSGTTGLPKAVALSHHALLNNAAIAGAYRNEMDGFDSKWETVRFAVTMSFAGSASFSSMLLPILKGCTGIALYATYNVDSMVHAMQDERTTEGVFFIQHASDLVAYPDISNYDFSNLRIVAMAGSVIPYRLRERVKKLSKYTTVFYGMTEFMVSCMNHPMDPEEVIVDDALFPVGGVEVKIVDDDGYIVPVDTLGEIQVRTYAIMKCYTGDEAKTKEFIDCNGWAHTGDIAKMDKLGFLRIRDRKKDLMIKEGVNISPAELEAVLYNHPSITGAIVVGVPDMRAGEEVCACIRIHEEESTLSTDEIIEYCKGKVFQLLIPKYVLFVKEFPTTENGKFSRKDMKVIAMDKLGIS